MVVVGSINMDLVVQVPHLPQPAETLIGSDFRCLPGGKGANQAVAIARLGGRSRMIGRVGDDAFGRELLRGLRAEGVDTRAVTRVEGIASGVAAIAVETGGQNCIAVVPGANGRLRPADLKALETLIAQADGLLLQLEVPLATVAAAARIARRHHVLTVLDTAPVPPGGLPRSLRNLDIVSPNQIEAADLAELPCETPEEALAAAEVLIQRLNPGVVVIKMGKLGAVAHAGGHHSAYNPGFAVKAVDTTAAGDAFIAALTLRLAEGENLGESLRFANAAGALACTRLGAQNSMPTRTEVDRFLRRNPAHPAP